MGHVEGGSHMGLDNRSTKEIFSANKKNIEKQRAYDASLDAKNNADAQTMAEALSDKKAREYRQARRAEMAKIDAMEATALEKNIKSGLYGDAMDMSQFEMSNAHPGVEEQRPTGTDDEDLPLVVGREERPAA